MLSSWPVMTELSPPREIPLPVAIRWIMPSDLPITRLGLGPILIGSGSQCDVVIEDKFVSEVHAEISREKPASSREKPAFVIIDRGTRNRGSKNGTFVNGVRILDKRTLYAGDVIGLGNAIAVVLEYYPNLKKKLATREQVGLDRKIEVRRLEWRLTDAQTELLKRLCAFGEQNKLLADALGYSDKNVEFHLSAILEKADADNRTELVVKVWSTAD